MAKAKTFFYVFYVEMTDTFGGDANYCWCNRYKVTASSFQGAIAKVSKATSYRFRMNNNYGDMARYDGVKSAVCAFVSQWDEKNQSAQDNEYYSFTEL